MTWNPTKHLQALAITLEVPFYHLELISKLEDIRAPGRLPIDRRLIRVGTLADVCECCITLTGAAKRDALVSKVHCVVYNSGDATGTSSSSGSSSRDAFDNDNDARYLGDDRDSGMNSRSSGRADRSGTNTDGATTSSTKSTKASASPLVIVDNSSTYGTYVVSAGGARKVSTKTTSGMPLQPGDLICIGVTRNGPQELAPIDASNAFIVYRVCCDSREKK
jgi:hypothetical protein